MARLSALTVVVLLSLALLWTVTACPISVQSLLAGLLPWAAASAGILCSIVIFTIGYLLGACRARPHDALRDEEAGITPYHKPPTVANTLFGCVDCPARFSDSVALRSHMEEEHCWFQDSDAVAEWYREPGRMDQCTVDTPIIPFPNGIDIALPSQRPLLPPFVLPTVPLRKQLHKGFREQGRVESACKAGA
ncbi:hypothetical protein MIND_00577400 [Mycena indigotica]|uniref:C2H2-type domain-containing protein n=1 Tax=Mycena indigotica TaxID=2126181 RepID=A0A8H6SQB6_9AGAR|nr:uncharacterized protein MIND_00577400 [Mycena indigotica]KAF7303484.1 hypothetical protein MIND_00577400 [Mycena indigotica]